jgi:UDP-N-acetyl-2-amino-2-deoxyglucuronate dehydrogenase
MGNSKLKFAVIGCCHIGKRHAEMISRNAESELVALIDVKKKEELNIDSYDVPLFNSLTDFLKHE